MINSLILIEGNVKKENLTISLSNALQVVIGRVPSSGWILHLAATSAGDYEKALLKFGQAQGVTGVVTLMMRNS